MNRTNYMAQYWWSLQDWFKGLSDRKQVIYGSLGAFTLCWLILVGSITGFAGFAGFKYAVLTTGILLGGVGVVIAIMVFGFGVTDSDLSNESNK